ncbi:MAG: hypothetical protein FWD15_05850 [Alphaproteobacteria bacterium]|nr:hypothetical protein [Alphaproteobacteria bacterium]
MGIRGYSQATETMKRNATVEDMISLVQIARTIYSARGVYGSNNADLSISTAVLSAKFGAAGSTGSATTPLGGSSMFELRAVEVQNADAGEMAPAARAFAVCLTGLTANQCIQFANMGWVDAVMGTDGQLISIQDDAETIPHSWSFAAMPADGASFSGIPTGAGGCTNTTQNENTMCVLYR